MNKNTLYKPDSAYKETYQVSAKICRPGERQWSTIVFDVLLTHGDKTIVETSPVGFGDVGRPAREEYIDLTGIGAVYKYALDALVNVGFTRIWVYKIKTASDWA